jgi:hypothetical protein
MKVLVCGGRKYGDARFLFAQLNYLHQQLGITQIIQGGASGADYLAKGWAYSNDIECREFKADWNKHGKAAGPIRNKQMLDEGKPDIVMAFPGGPGTANMMRLAEMHDCQILDYR